MRWHEELQASRSNLQRCARQASLNQNADSAQQQAYINYMMSKRDLPGRWHSNRSSALQSYNSQLSAAEQQKMAYQMQLEQALANGSAEILQNKYDTLQNLDNAYAQQILALQQAAAQAAQKRW